MNLPMKPEGISYKNVPIEQHGGGGKLMPQNFGEVVAFSEIMARSQHAIPKHLRDVPGACLAVTMQALRWEMDPFVVASKSYNVKDIIAYEAQLIAALVHTRAPIARRPNYTYTGDGLDRRCTVSALFDDGVERSYESPRVADIAVKNSPLWKADVDQQLGYYSVRAFARRYCPEVILGVYTPEEAETFRGPEGAKDVTPTTSLAARLEAAATKPTNGFSHENVTREIDGQADGAKTTELTKQGGADEVKTSQNPEPSAGLETGQAAGPAVAEGEATADQTSNEKQELGTASGPDDGNQQSGVTSGSGSEQPGTNSETGAQREAADKTSPPASTGDEPLASAKATSDDVAGAASETSSENRPPQDSGAATDAEAGAEPKPAPNLATYAESLRRMTQKTSMEKFAKKFWAENGGWPPADDKTYKTAKAIYNAVTTHVIDKKIDAKHLNEMLQEILTTQASPNTGV